MPVSCRVPHKSSKEDDDDTAFSTSVCRGYIQTCPNAQPPPHPRACIHTTPHSTMRKGLHMALRVGLDKRCVFLLVFLLCLQSGLGVASKQTGLLGLAVSSSGLLGHWCPAGGAAPHVDPPRRLCSREDRSYWEVRKWVCAHSRGAVALANALDDTPA